jgi:hypothetical protein
METGLARRIPLIGVIGSGSCDLATAELAEAVGRRIAEAGYGLVCGGLGGVMEAACRGAAWAGGLTVGILPGDEAEAANPHVRLVLPTGLGIARNVLVVRASRAIVAIRGGPGTLSEIAFALQLGKPVVGLETFDLEGIHRAAGPDEAVRKAIALAGGSK